MISVLMPVFNGERFLAEAIESVLAQTLRAFELIAVDDGSTDRTPEVLQRYARADARVRVVRCGHGGISAALNRGIAAAGYEWIARMDADDVAMPDRFAKQLAAAAAHPRVVAWGAYAKHINAAGRVLGVSRTGPTSEEDFRRLRAAGKDVHIIHPTAMLRKDVVLRVGGYDGRFDYCEDFELFDRMAEHGAIVAIPEPLLLYRIHATSISMERFFTMRRLASFVRARHKARLAGTTLTFEEFQQETSHRPALARVADSLHTASGFYYRNAGLAAAEGSHVRAGLLLAASAAMNPAYTIRRIWDQVLSAKIRGPLERDASDAKPLVPPWSPS